MLGNSLISISIIVPVYNGGSAFKECLLSLTRHVPESGNISTEIIVVADGCTDNSADFAEEMGAHVIQIQGPSGPARARNIGAKAAQGDILFFVDADVTIHSDTIIQAASLFRENPSLAAAIGSYDDSPGATNFLSQYKNLFHHYTHQTAQESASTFWGACGAIRRQVFWDIGGFDERYRKPSIEDIELGYRLKSQGYSIRLCKTLYVKHLKKWEPISLLKAEFFYRALPWTELLAQQKQMLNDLNLKLSSRISVVLTFGFIFFLVVSLFKPQVLAVAVISALALLVINFPVYRFFHRKRGIWFTLRVIFWHWLYFAYSGLAYVIGNVRYRLGKHSFSAGKPKHNSV